jgi:hypothetical protein
LGLTDVDVALKQAFEEVFGPIEAHASATP